MSAYSCRLERIHIRARLLVRCPLDGCRQALRGTIRDLALYTRRLVTSPQGQRIRVKSPAIDAAARARAQLSLPYELLGPRMYSDRLRPFLPSRPR